MPVQCPECARFLSNAFVAGLQKGPAPCPKCETPLRADQFDGVDDDATVAVEDAGVAGTATDPVPTAGTDAPPATQPTTPSSNGDGAAARADADASVRPPDLPPTEVRDDVPDVLAGWDQPSNVVSLDSRRHADPTSAGAAIGAGAAVGALLGALLADRSVRGALLGGSLGAVAGVAASQAMAKRHEVDLIE